jgi:hypothetical protein
MGYFAYAYVVEATELDDHLLISRSIYTVDLDNPGHRALFSWDQGERPEGMHSYATDSLFCDHSLQLLKGYPLKQRSNLDGVYRINEGFTPHKESDSILFHLSLPVRFVPCADRPLKQPTNPNVALHGNRIIVSYGAQGPTEVQFWIRRLQTTEEFDHFDLTRVLAVKASRSVKVETELNFGIIKFKFS